MYLNLHMCMYTTLAHCSSEAVQVENKCVHFYVFILFQPTTRYDYLTEQREIGTAVQNT